MIRFCCEQCGHKIGVEDGQEGKRGKCPACGTVFAVPAESTVIDFNCANCGRVLSALKIHAGRKIICPLCQRTLVVPAGSETLAQAVGIVHFACSMCHQEIEEPEDSRGKLIECPHCKEYVPVPIGERPAQEAPAQAIASAAPDKSDEYFEQLESRIGETPAKEPDRVTERKLPWLLDIFLYPMSKAGLVTLAIVIFVPLFIGLAETWAMILARGFAPLSVFSILFSRIGAIITLVIVLYLYWYFCECIRDSAAGGVRAPETLATTPGLDDLLWPWLRTICCLAVFALPTLIYYGRARQTDAIFWALLAVEIYVFPMGLLAVVMFDSFAGLNPILLIGSVFSTFLPYCAMVATFALVAFLIIVEAPNIQGSAVLSFIISCVGIYLSLVVAHLLGWFYHCYERKLNWDV